MVAILDLHWAAPSTEQANEEWPMADADHSYTFWSQVASAFKSDPSVIFQPFNEPFIGGSNPDSADWTCWLNGCSYTFPQNNFTYQTAGMQQLVNTIRSTGATQPILVSGLNWSGDPCGTHDTDYSGGCMMLNDLPSDPLNQLIISMHSYYQHSACYSTSCYQTDVLPIIAKMPLIFDEFGQQQCTADFDNTLMDWADQYNLSYLAWTWEAVANTDSCATSSDAINQRLNADWNGDVNIYAPGPIAINAHYLTDSWYYGSPPSPSPTPTPTPTSTTPTSKGSSSSPSSTISTVLSAPFNAVNTAISALTGKLNSTAGISNNSKPATSSSSSSKTFPTSYWGMFKYVLTNNSYYKNSLVRKLSEGIFTAIILAVLVFMAAQSIFWFMRRASYHAVKKGVATGKFVHGKVSNLIKPNQPPSS